MAPRLIVVILAALATLAAAVGPSQTKDSRHSPDMEQLLQGYRDLLNVSTDDPSTPFCDRLKHLCLAEQAVYDEGPAPEEKPSVAEVWGLGFAFVTLINVSSVFGVIFLPFMNKKFFKKLLMVMVGLAIGSLSSSAVFHLIPQAFKLVEDASHGYLKMALTLWIGVWAFFMVERTLRIMANRRNLSGHEPIPTKESSATFTSTEGASEEEEGVVKAVAAAHTHGHQHHHVQFRPGKDSTIATVAWMVVFGDGFHNFIDGVSIGAAFNESVVTGISISLAVLCEELPHEFGDFAVLLSSGMTMRQALVANFLSACTCYAGLVVGVLLGEFDASVHVFAFAAGMFLYISLVDMMPELNAAMEEASKRGVKAALEMLFLQNIGLLAGVTLLFSLAQYQNGIPLW